MIGPLRESVKKLAYRLPPALGIMTPRYPYQVEPAVLAGTVSLVERSREAGGSVVEVGVAKGDTSVFVLEHMRSVGDDRPVVFVDTFDGFTPESVEHEVSARGKRRQPLRSYRYGDRGTFERKLRRLGYENFEIVEADAARFDWGTVAPIGAMLLDVDLYLPTKTILEAAHPLLCPGGGIIVDDCVPDRPWDGAWQACAEFCAERGVTSTTVGRQGRLLTGVDR